MATTIHTTATDILSLEEYIDFIMHNVDLDDAASLIESAPKLKALANNKHLLRNQINQFLKSPDQSQGDNLYTDNSFIFWKNFGSSAATKRFMVRANVWLEPKAYGGNLEWDALHKAYNIAHNHNFSLLTAGYWGGGYATDIFEVDESKIVGYVGEKVQLTFLERTRLNENSMIFFRRFKDVHIQYPPEDLSISLNLIPYEAGKEIAEQFDFDMKNSTISAIAHTNVWDRVNLLKIASLVGDENTYDIIDEFSQRSTCPRTRLAALEGLTHMHPADMKTLWERGMRDSSALVRQGTAANLATNRQVPENPA